MQQQRQSIVPKVFLTLLNQLYEIERKLDGSEDLKKVSRNIDRIKDALRTEVDAVEPETEIYYEDPMGQKYDETRNDLEAHIAGESTESLVVVDVIKPIIRVGNRRQGISQVVQRGMVTVESKMIMEGANNE